MKYTRLWNLKSYKYLYTNGKALKDPTWSISNIVTWLIWRTGTRSLDEILLKRILKWDFTRLLVALIKLASPMIIKQLTVSAVIRQLWILSKLDTHSGENSTKYLVCRISYRCTNLIIANIIKSCNFGEMAWIGQDFCAHVWKFQILLGQDRNYMIRRMVLMMFGIVFNQCLYPWLKKYRVCRLWMRFKNYSWHYLLTLAFT